MDFLALCQALVRKVGISGRITTTAGQTGEMGDVVGWIDEAWLDLQRKNTNWDWMRYDFTVNSVAAQRAYAPTACTDVELGSAITSFSKWHKDTLRIYHTATGRSSETFLNELPYKVFRDVYQLATEQSGPPDTFAVRPRDKSLLLGPMPDGIYTVWGDYQRAPRSLSGNTDVPDLPEEYHWLIVHLAAQKYATFEAAPEVLADATTNANRMMDALLETQTEEVELGEPLA